MAISAPTDIGTVVTVANSGTQAFNTTVTIPPGAKVWVVVGWFDAVVTLSSVGGGGLTWTIDHQGKNGSVGIAIVSADAPAGVASGTTITATYSAGTADRFMLGGYATGVKVGVGAAYGATGANDAVAAWSSTGVTINSGDILIGASHTSQASGSPTNTPTSTEVQGDISAADGDSAVMVWGTGAGASLAASGSWSGSGWTNRNAAVAYRADQSSIATRVNFIYLRKNV